MKKFLATVLSIILVLSVMPISVFAAGSGEPTVYHDEIYYDADGAMHKRTVDENGREVEFERSVSFDTAETLPTSYDARDYDLVTSVKNQNPFGTCWAHSFCAAAESSLISQGYATKDNIDLSEAHLIWFRSNNYVEGSSIPVQLDKRTLPDPNNTGLDEFTYGGSDEESVPTVARWSGFVREADFPYNNNDSSAMHFNSSDMFRCDFNLTSAVFYQKNTDMNKIKQAILKNGALSTSYYHVDSYGKRSSDGYCYYQTAVQNATNHAITVIGWDDNFSRKNFAVKPESDGAWLVKNSWGTNWGDSGYFWLSYCDKSNNQFCEVNVKPAGEYNNNYQYDGIACMGYFSYSGTSYAANIFRAQKQEKIKAASFYVADDQNYQCSLSVYTDLTSSTNPKSGTLRESKTINATRKGFYTIEFNNSYLVNSGSKFAIILRLENKSGGAARVRYEYVGNENFVYNFSSGQSFYSGNGTSWTDCASRNYGNVPIKAYTEDYDPVTVNSVSITSMPIKTEYYTGQSLDLTGLKLTATYSDGTTGIVPVGDISASGFDSSTAGTKTVVLSYGGKTASFEINVIDVLPVSLEIISYPKTTYYVGDKFETSGLKVKVYYNDGSSKNASSVSLSYPSGMMNTPGTKTITVTAEGLKITYDITVLAVELISIEIVNLPTKLVYSQRDTELDTTNLALMLSYNNGKTENIMSGFTCSGFDISTQGEKEIIVSYGGFTDSYYITVQFIFADYSVVNEKVSLAQSLLSGYQSYTAESAAALNDAVNSVVYGLTDEYQAQVDGYAAAIENAIKALVPVHIHGDTQFIPVSREQLESGVLTSGNYYFDTQTVTNGIEIVGDVSICLCGNTVNFVDCSLVVNSGSILRICSCESEGSILFNGGSVLNEGRLEIIDAAILNNGAVGINNDGILVLDGSTSISSSYTDIIAYENSDIVIGESFNVSVPISVDTETPVTLNKPFVFIGDYSCDCAAMFNLINSDYEFRVENGQLIVKHIDILFPAEGSLTIVDGSNMLVSGLKFGLDDLSEYISVAEGYTYECDGFGTGAVITVYKGGSVAGTYQLVIFGDVTGDCWADGMDELLVNCLLGGMLDEEYLGSAAYTAADCNHDGVVDTLDAELLRQAGVLMAEIRQAGEEPESSETYTEYVQLISQSVVAAEEPETEEIDTAFTLNLFEKIILFVKMLISFICFR